MPVRRIPPKINRHPVHQKVRNDFARIIQSLRKRGWTNIRIKKALEEHGAAELLKEMEKIEKRKNKI